MNSIIRLTKTLAQVPRFYLHPDKTIIFRDEKSGYFLDPELVSRRLIKLIALHDDVKHPEQITLSSTWHEIGLNEMTYVEVMVEAEREFEIEFPDDDVESFRNVRDVVEYVSRSFFTI